MHTQHAKLVTCTSQQMLGISVYGNWSQLGMDGWVCKIMQIRILVRDGQWHARYYLPWKFMEDRHVKFVLLWTFLWKTIKVFLY